MDVMALPNPINTSARGEDVFSKDIHVWKFISNND
jgi:hypothetical protein